MSDTSLLMGYYSSFFVFLNDFVLLAENSVIHTFLIIVLEFLVSEVIAKAEQQF